MAKEKFTGPGNDTPGQTTGTVGASSQMEGAENLEIPKGIPYEQWKEEMNARYSLASIGSSLEFADGICKIVNPKNAAEYIEIKKNNDYPHGFFTWKGKELPLGADKHNPVTDNYRLRYRKLKSNTSQTDPQDKYFSYGEIKHLPSELKIRFGKHGIEDTGEGPLVPGYRKPHVSHNKYENYFELINKTILNRQS